MKNKFRAKEKRRDGYLTLLVWMKRLIKNEKGRE
jgi:hypothetical protein